MRFLMVLSPLLSVATLMSILCWSDSAEAQVLATEPEPAPATIAVPPSASPAPEQPDPIEGESQWYGDSVLIAGAITVPMMVGNMTAVVFGEDALSDVGIAYGVLSSIAHVVSGPAIHAGADGDRHGYKISVSVALRLGLMATSETTALVICKANDSCSDGVLVGAFAAGAALPVLVEATLLSWKSEDEEHTHSPRPAYAVPYAAPTRGGASIGVTGVF